jgi:hypothetical protein
MSKWTGTPAAHATSPPGTNDEAYTNPTVTPQPSPSKTAKNKKWGKADKLQVLVVEQEKIYEEQSERVVEAVFGVERWIEKMRSNGYLKDSTPLDVLADIDFKKSPEQLGELITWADTSRVWLKGYRDADGGVRQDAEQQISLICECVRKCQEVLRNKSILVKQLGEHIKEVSDTRSPPSSGGKISESLLATIRSVRSSYREHSREVNLSLIRLKGFIRRLDEYSVEKVQRSIPIGMSETLGVIQLPSFDSGDVDIGARYGKETELWTGWLAAFKSTILCDPPNDNVAMMSSDMRSDAEKLVKDIQDGINECDKAMARHEQLLQEGKGLYGFMTDLKDDCSRETNKNKEQSLVKTPNSDHADNADGSTDGESKEANKESQLIGDALHLISKMSLEKRDVDINRRLVHGKQPAGDIVVQIGNDVISQADMKRLQGPLPPSGTEPEDLWLNDTVLNCLRNILVDMDSARCAEDKSRKQVYFGDSFFYQKLMNLRNTIDPGKRGKYDYKEVAQQCRRVPCGSLLDVHACYFPILVNENHWVGSAILNESKEILLYDPRGKKDSNAIILNNLLRLVCDEFRRTQDSNESAIGALKKKWTLVDVSSDPPCQDNGK